MKIETLQSILDNISYVVHKLDGFEQKNLRDAVPVYNCSPVRMKDGIVKKSFIEVGYLYLTSAVNDDSQGYVWFDCTDRINYDSEHKIILKGLPEQISDKIVGKHNNRIAQIFNEETKEYLHKDSNIRWYTSEGQALFTTLEEAEKYIEDCASGNVHVPNFHIKVNCVTNPTKEDYDRIKEEINT